MYGGKRCVQRWSSPSIAEHGIRASPRDPSLTAAPPTSITTRQTVMLMLSPTKSRDLSAGSYTLSSATTCRILHLSLVGLYRGFCTTCRHLQQGYRRELPRPRC
ncbi:unnamed protein product [Scytosiphon promiscuus]